MQPLTTREAWLLHFATRFLWPRIEAAGGTKPERYRVSVGFPKGRRGSKGHAIGQCWGRESSADATYEVFISPELSAVEAVATLGHELTHIAAGLKCGHGAPFRKIAVQIGLTGPMRATVPGAELAADIAAWIASEPPYPHAPLAALLPGGKPGSRLLKASCEGCGYTVRLARQWLEVAVPTCPDPDCDRYQESMESPAREAFKRPLPERHPEPRVGLSIRET
jgi:hypothetical protein